MEADLPINWDLHDLLLERINQMNSMELNVMSCLYINKWVPICRESVQCLIKMRLELKSGTQGAAENACPLIDVLATV